MIIRLEEEKDYFEVENLTRDAFWNVYRPGCMEHLIVHKLRDDEIFIKELCYVIEEDNKIVANIVYARCYITKDDGTKVGTLLFGPVSVLPEHQHKGYGRAIIEHTMNLAKDLGYSEIIITGNPEYYNRFGFVPASKYNIFYEGIDKNEDTPFFMVKSFDEDKTKAKKGVYIDPDLYLNISDEELDEFDAKFEPKVKEKREGQLV